MSTSRYRYQFTSADLETKDVGGINWIVEDILPEGLAILASPPKVGKTFLCMQIANAVANGTDVIGLKANQGSVLYYALEDNERRIKDRLAKIGATPSDNLIFELEAQTISNGLIDDLEETVNDHPDLRLVVVDVLSLVRDPMDNSYDAYNGDYVAIERLQKFAIQRHLCVLLVTHFSKQASREGAFSYDDPFSSITGSAGLVGAADTVMLIAGRAPKYSLLVSGRDVQRSEIKIVKDEITNEWFPESKVRYTKNPKAYKDENEKYFNSPIRKVIVDLVNNYRGHLEIPLVKLAEIVSERCKATYTVKAVENRIFTMRASLENLDKITIEKIYFNDPTLETNKGIAFARKKDNA